MKILLGDFNIEVGIENIFKLTIGMTAYIRTVMILMLE